MRCFPSGSRTSDARAGAGPKRRSLAAGMLSRCRSGLAGPIGLEGVSAPIWLPLTFADVALTRDRATPPPTLRGTAAGVLGLAIVVAISRLALAQMRVLATNQDALRHALRSAAAIAIIALLAVATVAIAVRARGWRPRPGGQARRARPPAEVRPAGSDAHLITQLQAHFLFNVLNDAAELVHADPDAADDLIASVGEFLRAALLHTGRSAWVPLRDELRFMRDYADIQVACARGRVSVRWEVAPEVLDAVVPIFIWQPILENAFRHGPDPATGRLRVEIGARREGGDLALWVRDYGQGVGKAGAARCRGVGLSNTVARLEGLYGAAASLDLQEAGAGVLALIRVPLRTDEGTAPGSPR
jgi:hypothetical protein